MLAAILKLDIQRWIFWTNGQCGILTAGYSGLGYSRLDFQK
jgi:hypothetical protein